MTGPDVAGVLAGHQRAVSLGGPCICGEWPPPERDVPYNAHVAAAVNAEVARWLTSEEVLLQENLAAFRHEAETPMRGHDKAGACCRAAALSALAEQLAPARGDGGGS